MSGDTTLRVRLEARLGELRAEQQAGVQMQADLEARQAEVQQILLRISGAIQVLEELLEPPSRPDTAPLPDTVPESRSIEDPWMPCGAAAVPHDVGR